MKRIEALVILDEVFASDPLVITCGATAREMASLSRKKTHLPLLDSMGLTTPVGLGIALGHNGRVGVIDGDGSLLMGFSILPTLKAYAPKNLIVIVLDNGQHASADGMYSQANVVEIAGAAKGLGLWTAQCDSGEELKKLISSREKSDEVSLIFVKIETGNTPNIPFYLADPAKLGADFIEAAAG
jgi:thiamine pyrophosphate-dependent acetolactate synthase large subunit-like protein